MFFSHFLKILIFGPWVPIFGPKMYRKTSGRSSEGVDGQICLTFGTFIDWGNSWEIFCRFVKILIFGYLGPGTKGQNGRKATR